MQVIWARWPLFWAYRSAQRCGLLRTSEYRLGRSASNGQLPELRTLAILLVRPPDSSLAIAGRPQTDMF
jgi:hypothetical protein